MRSPFAFLLSTLTSALLLLSGGLLSGCDCGGEQVCTSNSQCAGDWICLDGQCTDPMARPDSGRVEPGCIDNDGDGRGEGCAAGPDCDDTSTQQTGVEVCDGLDNDCDGEADNGVLSACGDCNLSCQTGGTEPFDPETEESESVGVDEDGSLVLDSRRVETNFIWVANTAQGTVSKIDTRTRMEVARYVTGPLGLNAGEFAGNDPSRTSVNSLGDVYVGNRDGRSVTKIAVNEIDCIDRNGNGMIDTSTGGGDLRPWMEDECVLWHTSVPDGGYIRGMAAYDEFGPDGSFIPWIFVGGFNGILWKLDGDTGEIVFRIASPTNNYGLALDGNGNLWASGRGQNALGRIDILRCVDEASCTADPVCGDDGDDCVRQRIDMGRNPYGITVDFNQRVWLANHGTTSVSRYDPSQPLGSRWIHTNIGINCHGIAADGGGSVFCAGHTAGVVRLNAEDPSMWTVVADSAGHAHKGIAVDFDGLIWTITRNNYAFVFEPGAGLMESTVIDTNVDNGTTHYTYSDMTGGQLRLATNPRGRYLRRFDGCDPSDPSVEGTRWNELRWSAETPAGTSLLWRVRTGNSVAELDAATWVVVAEVPDATSPMDLVAALMDAGITPGRYLDVEVQLIAERASATEVISPRVHSMEVTYECISSGPG